MVVDILSSMLKKVIKRIIGEELLIGREIIKFLYLLFADYTVVLLQHDDRSIRNTSFLSKPLGIYQD